MQIDQPQSRTIPAAQAPATTFRWLDWALAIGGLWLLAGLHLDGWAHHRIELESFFTPWHAVLYSGYAVSAAAVGLAWLDGLRKGRSWRDALPRAYRTSLLGAVLFMLGGGADMTWHTLFGIEQSLEALLSPPHLFLAVGGTLLITGPLRAGLYSPGQRPTVSLPAVLSLISMVAMISFFTVYANPWIEASVPSGHTIFGFLPGFSLYGSNKAYLLAGILLQTLVLMGAVFLLVRRFNLPFGMLTLLFTLPVAMGAAMHENWGIISLALLGGLSADLLVRALRPGLSDSGTRLFAFLSPAILYLLYFGAFKLTGQLGGWSFELWGGAVLLAGITGWLLSYAFFAPEGEL